jgi:hypothetical protein
VLAWRHRRSVDLFTLVADAIEPDVALDKMN